MRIYISIDDTDNHDTIGSGQLAEKLIGELVSGGYASNCSTVSRHQLYFHDDIPYTSHNSSMCFSAVTADSVFEELTGFCQTFLENHSAEGSDPGLCVAPDSPLLKRDALITFGLRAKQEILTKSQAYLLADQTDIHLSEHGGTGDGVVGALAGIGLRLHGSDGRIRGWLRPGKQGSVITSDVITALPDVDCVIDSSGCEIQGNSSIYLTDSCIKTIRYEHRQVVPVEAADNGGDYHWKTLEKSKNKKF